MFVETRASGIVVASFGPPKKDDPRVCSRPADYDEQHTYCPECGSESICATTAGILCIGDEYRDGSHASCGTCGWRGIVHDLRSKRYEGTRTASQEMFDAVAAECERACKGQVPVIVNRGELVRAAMLYVDPVEEPNGH